MKETLKELLNNSYAPYSKYPVSAIVKCRDGMLFKGVNVENASYGACICAERNAILNAVTNGYRKGDFEAIYVMNASEKVATPCFLCRQVIEEFFEGDSEVICYTENDELKLKVSDLCVYPFNEDNLK